MVEEFPQTEEGLQKPLAHLAEARQAEDDAAVGKALLKLSHLVRWVRSDNHEPSFDRSHTLALEALEVFGRIGDPRGQVSALLAAAPFADVKARGVMLEEAERLAEELGDENQIARVWSARAKQLALVDGEKAKEMHLRALEAFRRLGNVLGVAQALFSLSIGPGEPAEKRAYALEGWRLYREGGDAKTASMCLSMAVLHSQGADLIALEPMLLEAVTEAQDRADRSKEGLAYSHLAKVATAKGDNEGAARYLRWSAELKESDGLTPLERWEHNVAMTKMLIATAKRSGNKDTVKMFEEELAQLKKQKPKRGS